MAEQNQEKTTWQQRWVKFQAFFVENFLVIAFAVAIIFAMAYPVPGRYLVNIVVLDNVHILQEISMGIVFFLSGLALNTQDLKKAVGHWLGVGYGLLAILILTPCLGFAVREIPLEPQAFSVGLTIFAAVPTTLGVGIALVRSCKGNEGVALLLTVVSNLLGVVIMPPMLKLLFLGYETPGLNVRVDILDLFIKLLITIFAPSVIGKALRDGWKPAEQFAKRHSTKISMLSTANLAFIIWQTLSGARSILLEQQGAMIVSVIVLAIAMHIFYLVVNYVVIWHMFKMPIKEAIATGIMASQKSAPVAVTVISYITSVPAEQGLLAIPSIVGQISQIFLDAAIAKWLARQVQAHEKAQTEAGLPVVIDPTAPPDSNGTNVLNDDQNHQPTTTAVSILYEQQQHSPTASKPGTEIALDVLQPQSYPEDGKTSTASQPVTQAVPVKHVWNKI